MWHLLANLYFGVNCSLCNVHLTLGARPKTCRRPTKLLVKREKKPLVPRVCSSVIREQNNLCSDFNKNNCHTNRNRHADGVSAIHTSLSEFSSF